MRRNHTFQGPLRMRMPTETHFSKEGHAKPQPKIGPQSNPATTPSQAGLGKPIKGSTSY